MAGGRRGPAPLPTAVKSARGTAKKSREAPGKEPKPPVKAPGVPPTVASNPTAKAAWERLVPRLIKLRVLAELDGYALEGLCMAYARAISAEKEIKKHGLLTKTSWGTLVQNPAISVAKAAWIEVRKFSQEFGLTPSSRTRVREVPNEDGDEQGAAGSDEDFLFGGGSKARVVGSIGR